MIADPKSYEESKVRKILVQDDDCHWYLIDEDQESNFEKWERAMMNDQDTDLNFENQMINSPRDVKIKVYEIK